MKKYISRLLCMCSLFGLFGCAVDLSNPSSLPTSKIVEAEVCVNSGEQEGYVYTIPKEEIEEFVETLLEEERTFTALEEEPKEEDYLFKVTFCDSTKKKLAQLLVYSDDLIKVENKYYAVDPAFDEDLIEECLDAKSH